MTAVDTVAVANNANSARDWISGARTLGGTGLLLAALAILPSFLGPFNIVLGAQILAYSVVALSLQLLWGRAGQLSFGQAAFFGMGAYAYAILGTRDELNGWYILAAALVIPAGTALILGYFLFFGRVRDAYFSIVTLAFVLVANQVVISWRSVTGGDTGLTRVPGLVLPFGGFEVDFTLRNGRYYLGLLIFSIALFVALLVRRSSFGLVLEAIRDDENRASFLGYNTPMYLTMAFTLSAALAGVAGGAFASISTLAAPDMIDQFLSIQILTWVAIGGRNYLAGALVGTVVMRVLNNQVSDVLPESWPLVVGLFFVVVVMFFPAGLVGGLAKLRAQLASRRVEKARA